MPPPSKTIPEIDRYAGYISKLGPGSWILMKKTKKIGFMPDFQPVKYRILVHINGRRFLYPEDMDYMITSWVKRPQVIKVEPRKKRPNFVNRYAVGILPPVRYDENGKEL